MFSGMFLMMFGGWLPCLCTYSGVLFGFMYGLCSPVRRSIVMSIVIVYVPSAGVAIEPLW